MTARKIAALTASLWLAACLGTGTDTENGIDVSARVLSPQGAPMASVEVRVHALDAGPEASADPLKDQDGVLRTDGDGYVHFTVRRAGIYMAEGLRGDSVLLLDTLTVSKSDTTVFQTAGVQRLRGRLRLYSGYRVDTGLVFVRGSSIAASVNRDGEYDFGYVPAAAAGMAVGAQYDAKPTGQVFVKVADAGSTLVVDARFTLDTTLAPLDGKANLTLFKASESATNVCLDAGSRLSVEPGISLRGSLANTRDIRVAAGYACSDKVGAQVKVEETSPDGKSNKDRGNFILPDGALLQMEYRRAHGLSAKTLQKIVIPVSCVTSGDASTYTTVADQDSSKVDIRVDDIGLESGCPF